ncbi:uncharacterized protein LOC100201479 isoform X2 [Hydra vulgaris]|uniref:uncharacterized protein LOC100201479 isoform X2 n=1 Tax=Hydra vulgaris TaxID=6087 RepID=UPI0032E9CD68
MKIETENCLNDIIMFITVNSLFIEVNKLIILGTIILPLIKREELNEELFFIFSNRWNCQIESSYLKQILFLCKDDITNENFERWWRIVDVYCKKKKNVQNNNTTFFKKLVGLTIIVIAKVNMKNYIINIPTLEDDPQKQIESLILNHEQWVAIHDRELKKIITGGYGSGKSVVGKEIVKKCIKKPDENLTLYYICCNHFSLYECEMKRFVDSIKKKSNVTVVCDNLFELWQTMCINKNIIEENICIPKLLEYLVVSNSNKVCFVLEELSPDYVKDEDVVKLINNLFSSVLKDSLFVFIPESVEKFREIITSNKKQLIQKNYFNEEALDMKVFTLEKTMRVTKCNKSLIDSSQESICESKTVFNFPSLKKDQILLQNTYSSKESKDESMRQSKLSNSNEVGNNFNHVEVESTIDIIEKKFHEYDLDHVSKYVAIKSNDEVSNCFMETSFVFKLSSMGHSIKGEKPTVVYFPFNEFRKKRSAKFLSVVLECLFSKTERKIVVICNNIEEVQSVGYAIDIGKYKAVTYSPHLQKYTPKITEKIEITKKLTSEFDILVTDCKGFSGCESETVVVLVRPDEIYLRHVLVDAIARSNSHLIVLVLNYNGGNKNINKKGTIGNVLNNWSEDQIEKIIVNVSNKENQLWTLEKGSLLISESCKDFIDRGSKLKFSIYKSKIEFRVLTENYLKYEASYIYESKINQNDINVRELIQKLVEDINVRELIQKLVENEINRSYSIDFEKDEINRSYSIDINVSELLHKIVEDLKRNKVCRSFSIGRELLKMLINIKNGRELLKMLINIKNALFQ